jgi:hypothetical protein
MTFLYLVVLFFVWAAIDHLRTRGIFGRGNAGCHGTPEYEAFWAGYDGASSKFQDILALHSEEVSSTALLRSGLCGACGGGCPTIVRTILSLQESGADARCLKDGYSPLHYVAGVFDEEVSHSRGWFFPGDSPTQRYAEVARLLIEQGADPSVRDTFRQLRPIEYAREQKRTEVYPYLEIRK